jgi:hypothetical protein
MNTAPRQDQLFKRIFRITFVSGILIGILLTFIAVNLNMIVAKHAGISFLAFLSEDTFLYPCTLLVGGALLVLKGKLELLSTQLESIWQLSIPTVFGKRRGFIDPMIWGLFMIGLGSLLLIVDIWGLDLSFIWASIGIVGPLVLCLAVWYSLRRNNRRSPP